MTFQFLSCRQALRQSRQKHSSRNKKRYGKSQKIRKKLSSLAQLPVVEVTVIEVTVLEVAVREVADVV